MRKILGAVALSFSALGAQAAPAYTLQAEAKAILKDVDGKKTDVVYTVFSVNEEQVDAGSCLSHIAIYATHPMIARHDATYLGSCSSPSQSFSFECSAKNSAESAKRLYAAGISIHHEGETVDIDAADVKAICKTSSPIEPATRLGPKPVSREVI